MASYKDLPLSTFADLASKSNPELGAINNTLVDYYTGKTVARFDHHEGDGAEDTAIFLASARSIVEELIHRINLLQKEREAKND